MMPGKHTGRAVKGSRLHLQDLINGEYQINFGQYLMAQSHSLENFTDGVFDWKSPLESQNFREYRDAEFLNQVGLSHLKENLSSFWPRLGPCWDALAIVPGKKGRHGIVLVEAKSHVKEVGTSSSACGAKPKSLGLITASIEVVKDALGVNDDSDWLGKYYQYANRLAHLYWLTSQNIPVWMVFLYFTGDSEQKGPLIDSEWRDHLSIMKTKLGLPDKHFLSDRIIEVFLPVHH